MHAGSLKRVEAINSGPPITGAAGNDDRSRADPLAVGQTALSARPTMIGPPARARIHEDAVTNELSTINHVEDPNDAVRCRPRLRRFAEYDDVLRLFFPFHDSIVRKVAPRQISAATEPDWSFSPAHSANEGIRPRFPPTRSVLQPQSHLCIDDVCRTGAQRRERHAKKTNSFTHRKLGREQLRAD
jgi:hypothetical protein